MVLYAAGKLPARRLVSIGNSRNCSISKSLPPRCALAPAAPTADLRQHSVIAKEFSLLARAAAWTGGIANQNRGKHWEATLPTHRPRRFSTGVAGL